MEFLGEKKNTRIRIHDYNTTIIIILFASFRKKVFYTQYENIWSQRLFGSTGVKCIIQEGWSFIRL